MTLRVPSFINDNTEWRMWLLSFVKKQIIIMFVICTLLKYVRCLYKVFLFPKIFDLIMDIFYLPNYIFIFLLTSFIVRIVHWVLMWQVSLVSRSHTEVKCYKCSLNVPYFVRILLYIKEMHPSINKNCIWGKDIYQYSMNLRVNLRFNQNWIMCAHVFFTAIEWTHVHTCTNAHLCSF